MPKRVIVLDTSAFIMGYNPLSIGEEQFTTHSVIGELAYETTISLRFKIGVETGKIKLREPSPKSLREIEKSSSKIGDFPNLSKVDKEVLALALELKESGFSPVLVSDDYAVQNVADQLGLEYASLSTFGIRYRFQWVLYCPACHRRFSPTPPQKTCTICGTLLKKRVLRKIPTRRKPS